MSLVWIIAIAVLGIVLGLYFGRLLSAVILYWEGTKTATRATTLVVLFVLGGGGGSAIFRFFVAPDAGALYAIGLALGMLVAYFAPTLPTRYSLDSIRGVIQLSDALRAQVPDVDKRATLILSLLVPPKVIQRQAHIGADQLARELEELADELAGLDEEVDLRAIELATDSERDVDPQPVPDNEAGI